MRKNADIETMHTLNIQNSKYNGNLSNAELRTYNLKFKGSILLQ